MKKAVLTIAILALAICGFVLGTTRSDSKIAETTEFEYRQVTPDEEIVVGNATAIQSMREFLDGKEIRAGTDHSLQYVMRADMVSDPTTNQNFIKYSVEDYADEKFTIFFLFKDDTKVVKATEVDVDFSIAYAEVNSDNESYRTNENYEAGVFAWYYEHKASAIVDAQAGQLTSIWAYDGRGTVRLIWCNTECPIWKGHYGDEE